MTENPGECDSSAQRKEPTRHQFLAAGAHPHVAVVPADPKFKRKREMQAPRMAPVMVITWLGALFVFLTSLSTFGHTYFRDGAHVFDWPYAVNALLALIVIVETSYLWAAWEREETYPELLPKREFDRRYPPGPGAGPAMDKHREPLLRTGYPVHSGQKLNRNGAAAIPRATSSTPPPPPGREFHRRLRYDTDTTMTGGHTASGPPIRVQDLPRLPDGPAPGASA